MGAFSKRRVDTSGPHLGPAPWARARTRVPSRNQGVRTSTHPRPQVTLSQKERVAGTNATGRDLVPQTP